LRQSKQKKAGKIDFLVAFTLLFLLSLLLSSCVDTTKREALYQKGLEKYRTKDFLAAEALFLYASHQDPKHVPSMVMRGKSLFFAGQLSEARKVFQDLLQKRSDAASAVFWLARLDLLENKSSLDSEKRLLKLLAVDEENIGAHLLLARLYEKTARLPESAQQYELALSYDKELDVAKTKLRDIYLALGLKVRAARFETKSK
jgi:predicted Zn-dependent protease